MSDERGLSLNCGGVRPYCSVSAAADTLVMGNWWQERAALLDEAEAMIAAQADCSPDAALLLLKLRARELDCDLEEIARAVVHRQARFSSECLTEIVIEADTHSHC